MGPLEIILIVVCSVIVIGAIVAHIIRKKKGKSSCDCGACSGNCSCCHGADESKKK